MTLTPQESSELEFVQILKSKHARYIDGKRVIDADAVADDYTPPGCAFGQIDSSGQFGPVTRDFIDTGGAVASTNTIPLAGLNASDWNNWQVGDSVDVRTISAVNATLVTGVEGDNNALLWTAADAGTAGNGIDITLSDPSANDASLSITVNANDITVNLATGGTGDITTIASDIITAIEADADASALVDIENYGTSTGAGVVVAETGDLTGGQDADDPVTQESTTITSISETDGEIVVDSISTNYEEGTIVEKADGSSTAEFVCLELADVSEEDAIVGGITHGAVHADRLPNYDAYVAEDLNQIAFE